MKPKLRQIDRIAAALKALEDEEGVAVMTVDCNDNLALTLDQLPEDVLLAICKLIPRVALGRLAQTCSTLRTVSYSDCLWLEDARSEMFRIA